ncbi:hypothetical protein JHV675_51680 [Mycobacterium avium subsp. hominissuis]
MAAAVGAALVAAAFLLPRPHPEVQPRLDVGPERFATHAGAAPIFGEWLIHAGWGTGPAATAQLPSVNARHESRCARTGPQATTAAG